MLVRTGERTDLAAPANAEAADDVVWRDYYTRLPQIRLTGGVTSNAAQTRSATEIILDDNDVARLVECALRHPNVNMRTAVLAAIWSHPDSFRQILQFGLKAPDAFAEIRKIVADEIQFAASPGDESAGTTLLPRMPRPAHLKTKERSE